jgi:hypothetical protein
MKTYLPLLLIPSLLPLTLAAQTPATAEVTAPVAEKPKLTDQQVLSVLGQLKVLEADILAKRGTSLSSILIKLNEGMASDAAAQKLYTECELVVNSERKEETKAEARARAEQLERRLEGGKGKGGGGGGGGSSADEGDTALGIRLGLRYLIMTLEAHEAKEEDFKKMVPKLQTYIQDLVASAPKIKGRAFGMINRVCGQGSPIVDAFQLDRYLAREDWSNNPTNIGEMYGTTILKLAESEAKDSLPALWDARILAEAAFRKENMTAPEHALWLQNELPALRWERATYLYESGPSAINAMGDMLKNIKENPGHADAPSWVKQLRLLVNESAPTPVSSESDKPATN